MWRRPRAPSLGVAAVAITGFALALAGTGGSDPPLLAGVAAASAGAASVPSRGESVERGLAVYKRAGCVACHKWHGKGGGSYGGAALSLRETFLDRDQIVEVVRCGRPGTGMPYYDREAYRQDDCYGLTLGELGNDSPPRAKRMLRPSDIGLVADYVTARLRGKGEATKEECIDFFGEDSRACRQYD